MSQSILEEPRVLGSEWQDTLDEEDSFFTTLPPLAQ